MYIIKKHGVCSTPANIQFILQVRFMENNRLNFLMLQFLMTLVLDTFRLYLRFRMVIPTRVRGRVRSWLANVQPHTQPGVAVGMLLTILLTILTGLFRRAELPITHSADVYRRLQWSSSPSRRPF